MERVQLRHDQAPHPVTETRELAVQAEDLRVHQPATFVLREDQSHRGVPRQEPQRRLLLGRVRLLHYSQRDQQRGHPETHFPEPGGGHIKADLFFLQERGTLGAEQETGEDQLGDPAVQGEERHHAQDEPVVLGQIRETTASGQPGFPEPGLPADAHGQGLLREGVRGTLGQRHLPVPVRVPEDEHRRHSEDDDCGDPELDGRDDLQAGANREHLPPDAGGQGLHQGQERAGLREFTAYSDQVPLLLELRGELHQELRQRVGLRAFRDAPEEHAPERDPRRQRAAGEGHPQLLLPPLHLQLQHLHGAHRARPEQAAQLRPPDPQERDLLQPLSVSPFGDREVFLRGRPQEPDLLPPRLEGGYLTVLPHSELSGEFPG